MGRFTEKELEDYKQIKLTGPKRKVREVILRGISTLEQVRRELVSNNIDRVQFVYGHHVLDDEVDGFREMLAFLEERYELISYSDAVRRVMEGPLNRPFLCLSFDDGLRNCLRIGRILAEHDISACFFVCPGIIGEDDTHTLKMFANRVGLPPAEFLSWEEVEELQSLGHEIGGHTYSHRTLAELERSEVKMEITRTYNILQRYVDSPIHFAWPNGLFEHFTCKAAKTVFEVGFASCASAVRGCHTSIHEGSRKELCIRRDDFKAGEPLHNLRAFLALNTLLPWRQHNGWPEGWSGCITESDNVN